MNETPPYVDTCSNWLRSGAYNSPGDKGQDEQLFLDWSLTRPFIYSPGDNNIALPKDISKTDTEENTFLFPWNDLSSLNLLSNEIRELVEVELLNSSLSHDERASNLLDILGPEHFDLIQELCSKKTRVIRLPKTQDNKKTANIPKIPGIYSNSYIVENSAMIRHSVALPAGTIHECIPGRECFYFPAPNASEEGTWADMRELEITETFPHMLLAAGGKPLFPYTHLNRMQSAVYPVSFNSNENMLVAAPTGAGKTDVALMAILRVIWTHLRRDDRTLIMDRHAFKIVYIAPMKALAAEIASKYQQRLFSLGIVVREYTGDMRLTNHELDNTNILISTPEKWDVLTRNPSFADSVLGASIKLIVIDEVHLLNDSRGAVLETLVARTLRYVEGAQRMVRIVGLSATLPNFMEVAEWLRVSVGKGLFFFDSSFRPVPLKITLIGVTPSIRSSIQIEKEENIKSKKKPISSPNINHLLDRELVEGVRPILFGQHQALVFVHSRAQTIRVARLLSGSFGPPGLLWKIDPCPRVEYSPLRSLLSAANGAVAVHHAGLSRSDRQTVEFLFRSRRLALLVCTSTLAWGVNLPARAVFIRGTDIFNGGTWDNLSSLDVLQIFGRAGRPGLDDAGEATLLCSTGSLPHYLLSLSPANTIPIESTFAMNLDSHLNAEINLGTVRSIEDGLTWLSYTFLWVRTKQKGAKNLQALENILKSSIDRLVITGLCIQDNSMKLMPTELGEITSRFYLNVETVHIYLKKLEELSQIMFHIAPQSVLSAIIKIFSEAKEFTESIKMRSHSDSEDEELLRMLLGPKLWLQRLDVDPTLISINFTGSWDDSRASAYSNQCFVPLFDPTTVDWTSSSTKVSVLFQSYISGWGNTTSISKREKGVLHYDSPDLHYITLNAGRFLRAIFEISLRVIGDSQLAFIALELCRCFENRTWSTYLLSSDKWWNAVQLVKQAGCINPRDELVSKVNSSFDKELLCHGWSRRSPLQLALQTFSVNGIPWLDIKDIRSSLIQVIRDEVLLEIRWHICSLFKMNSDEILWAIIALPHEFKVIWSDSFILSKNQPILHCKVHICIDLNWFSDLNTPVLLNLSILNNQRIGLDLLDIPIPLGIFHEADGGQSKDNSCMLHPINSLREPIAPMYFLVGRGKISSLFPTVQRPFLEVSRVVNSPLLESLLHSAKIYSFSAIQSMMARMLLHPFEYGTSNIWAHGRNFISILAPQNSGKALTLELAIWGALNANRNTKVIVLTANSYKSYQLIKKWSYPDSILGILGISPSSSSDSDIAIVNPKDILTKWDHFQITSIDKPMLVIIEDIEMVGDYPEFETAVSILRYWTHSHPFCRWIIFGYPFASSPDMISWLSLGDSVSLLCGPEVSLSPCPVITKVVTNRMPGSIAAEISRIVSTESILVVWGYSRRFCRILASKLSIILARRQIGFIDDESTFPFKDQLLQRTVAQSGVAFWAPSEKEGLIASSSFIKVLLIPISPSTPSSFLFSFAAKIASGRLIDTIIILPHLQKSTVIDSSFYYTPYQISQMISVAKSSPRERRPKCIFLGPSELCSMVCLIVQSDNGYKLPIESSLIEFTIKEKSTPFIQLSLMTSILSLRNFDSASDFIISIDEIESFFQWTFLSRRIKSNPSYYGWADLRSLIIESLTQLDKLGSLSFNNTNNEIQILPHCRLSAFHSFSPATISNLDTKMQELWKN